MKILHITPWYPPHRGGIATHVFNLRSRLIERGYDVSVLTVKPLLSKAYNYEDDKQDKIRRVGSIYLPGWPYKTLSSVSIPIAARAIRDSILQHDIVHLHGLHYPLCWIGAHISHKYRIPSILTLHGTFALNPEVMSGKTRIEDFMYRSLFAHVMAKSNAIIGLTDGMTAMSRNYDKRSSNIHKTIGNGVNTGQFLNNLERKDEYRKKYGIPLDSIVVLFVGRFEPGKGIRELSEAVRQISESSLCGKCHFVFVGDGSLEKTINDLAARLPSVHSFGWVAHDSIHEFYILSDVYIIPSRFEGLPLSLLEAMTAGLYVIYTPVGGMPDILAKYPIKTLLNEVSIRMVTETILKVVSGGSINTMSNLDRRLYATNLDWDKTCDQITDLYKMVYRDSNLSGP